MDDVTRHPDDSTLFDLVEGVLDDARAEAVRTHLSRCAACAAFVNAARAGAPVTETAVEPMPAAAAARLHAAVGTAWRERVAGIAATEAAEDASAGSGEFAGFAPIEPPAAAADGDVAKRGDAARTAMARPRRARRLVPVLAFVVLGALAGTSLLISDETADRSTSVEIAQDDGGDGAGSATEAESESKSGAAPQAEPSMAPDDDTFSEDGLADGGIASGGAPAGAPVDGTAERGAAATDSAAGADAATSGAVPPPTADYDDFVDQTLTCIATRDDTQLALPDGQIPTQITRGPFDIYLVCG